MKREDILEKYDKLPEKIVHDQLTTLGNLLFKEQWGFIEGVSSRIRPKIYNKEYMAEIGHDWLNYDCDVDSCNKAGYVIVVEHMYHEYRHIQQQVKEWNTVPELNSVKSINRMTDIVRRNFVRSFYDSVYTHNYRQDPSEMDAEIYGLIQTAEYFKSNSLVTQYEAKEILFQLMMSEDYGYNKELSTYSIKLFDDMLNAFADLRDTSVHKLYPITIEISPAIGFSTATEYDMTEEFLTSYRYRTHREELKHCTDGKEMDKLLEQTIVMKYPDIAETVPRLQDELNKCREQMQSRILTPKYHAVLISKINYAGLEDEFTKAVNNITENDDLKL